MCATCDDRSYQASRWFYHIDRLYCLARGGFPFRRNELSLEEWQDIGVFKQLLDDEKENNRIQMMMVGRH